VGPFEGWFTLFWVLALVAALLTAFYMTRLMVLTFHGESRLGEKDRAHVHEVPAVMWVPLAVLALLAIVGGWLNIPEVIADAPLLGWVPGGEWLHHWLEPVVAPAAGVFETHVGALAETAPLGGGAVLWAFVAFLLAVAVVAVTAVLLSHAEQEPAIYADEPRGLARVLGRNWYVDELYDRTVVRPVLAISRGASRWIDHALIDGLVNGGARVSAGLGWVGARLQSGQLNSYAFALVVGALLILGFVAL
ncbi:MAG: hypothetical protein ACRELX_11670, partial [Longimicrobiales bacterium]